MSDIVFEASPRSGDSIEGLADAARVFFGFESETFFPIVEFVEKGLPVVIEGLTFDVIDAAEMGARMGAVDPISRSFFIREDVYSGAIEHRPRDRFTMAHESGHALMHFSGLNRATPSRKVETFRDPEWQANRFAGAILMPRALIVDCRSISEIMQRFGVSRDCAETRVKTLKLVLK